MHELVRPSEWVAIKLPSDAVKILQVIPNTTITLGKYGSFPSNLIIDRPYHLTYEVQDKREGEQFCRLRIVPAAEIHNDTLAKTRTEEGEDEDEGEPESVIAAPDGAEYNLLDSESGNAVVRSHREVLDYSARQTLTMEEIEVLKKEGTDAGKEIIAKLLLSHKALDQKNMFSLAKYKLLKTKKYIRRFTISPLDSTALCQYLLDEKDPSRVLELRQEGMGLMTSWSNVHFGGHPDSDTPEVVNIDDGSVSDMGRLRGRWLVIDDTGGLLVASMAERMGILYRPQADWPGKLDTPAAAHRPEDPDQQNGTSLSTATEHAPPDPEEHVESGGATAAIEPVKSNGSLLAQGTPHRRRAVHHRDDLEIPFSPTNTLTLIHANSQPNLALLKHYDFDIANPEPPEPSHPLVTHLLPISWLQLLEPEMDSTYSIPAPSASAEEMLTWKAARRGHYHRKRRRWARSRYIVQSTQAGGFSGLAVASTMDPVSLLRHTLPLLTGGAPVAIYSQTIEPLVQLADYFSVARRAGWATSPPAEAVGKTLEELERWEGTDDFPLNPTLLLGTSIQTSRARRWQVLPGRTHPIMTAKGGADGFVFTGRKTVPAEGKIEARGKFKRRKVDE